MIVTTIADEPFPPKLTYPQLFVRFLRFGLLAFGGPVVSIGVQKGPPIGVQ